MGRDQLTWQWLLCHWILDYTRYILICLLTFPWIISAFSSELCGHGVEWHTLVVLLFLEVNYVWKQIYTNTCLHNDGFMVDSITNNNNLVPVEAAKLQEAVRCLILVGNFAWLVPRLLKLRRRWGHVPDRPSWRETSEVNNAVYTETSSSKS